MSPPEASRRRAVGPYVRYFDRGLYGEPGRQRVHDLSALRVVFRPAKQASNVQPGSIRLTLPTSGSRVRNAASLSFKDWHAIGRAIRIGRRLCTRATHSEKPQGRRYSDAMSAWLVQSGFDEIREPTRCEAVKLVEEIAISEWRDTQPEHERVRLNHPRSILHAYDLAGLAERRRDSTIALAQAARRSYRWWSPPTSGNATILPAEGGCSVDPPRGQRVRDPC